MRVRQTFPPKDTSTDLPLRERLRRAGTCAKRLPAVATCRNRRKKGTFDETERKPSRVCRPAAALRRLQDVLPGVRLLQPDEPPGGSLDVLRPRSPRLLFQRRRGLLRRASRRTRDRGRRRAARGPGAAHGAEPSRSRSACGEPGAEHRSACAGSDPARSDDVPLADHGDATVIVASHALRLA
jgi:hypothetical protein